MKDMFYNYNNNIDKKEYSKPLFYPEEHKELSSDPNVKIIKDIKGNEIGVQVRQNTAFSLFFELEGCVKDSSIGELVNNSTISFEILDHFHNVIIEKTLTPANAFLSYFDTIKIDINRDEAMKLKAETYGIRLALAWPGGGYDLFAETNGKLIVR